nr:hypothetical protein [Candidatus Freyarchaeota archaeon]
MKRRKPMLIGSPVALVLAELSSVKVSGLVSIYCTSWRSKGEMALNGLG